MLDAITLHYVKNAAVFTAACSQSRW